MNHIALAIVIALCLIGASIGSIVIHKRLPEHNRDDVTHGVIRQITNIFVIIASLVLGLMIGSAKTTFESADSNYHAFASGLIVFDRTLRQYGPEMADTRRRLMTYVERAARDTSKEHPGTADHVSERMLRDVDGSLRAIVPKTAEQKTVLQEAREQFRSLVALRWTIVGQADGSIPSQILIMLVAWLMLIFASFGFRAPANAVVLSSLVVASVLVAGAIYVIMDLDGPFDGEIKVSPAPLQRAITELKS